MNPRRSMSAGRRWAYGGAALGISLSVAANVEHVLVQSRNTAPGAVVSAAAAPVILLVALEVIARTTWPAGLRWALLRWLALPTVAVVAASISYLHMRSLLLVYGESTWAATVGPLAVDGLMAVALGALLVPLDDGARSDEGPAVDVIARPAGRAQSHHERRLSGDASKALAGRRAEGAGARAAASSRRRGGTQSSSRPLPAAAGAQEALDDARTAVLRSLADGPARQAELVRATGLPRRTVRDHLVILLRAGLIAQSGQQYSLTDGGRRAASIAQAAAVDGAPEALEPAPAVDGEQLIPEARELDGAGVR